MRSIVWLFVLLPTWVIAQQEPVQSAISPWILVDTRAVAPFKIPTGPGFIETFSEENPNRWFTGLRAGFTYALNTIGYQIERRSADTNRFALSWHLLPKKLILNKMDTFLVQVDLFSRSDMYPNGGLLFGVADALNYNQVRLIGKDKVVVQQIVRGNLNPAFASVTLSTATVALRPGRNRVAVWRRGNQLHVFVNDRELPTSPFPFRGLRGNGVGVMLAGNWLAFRNLTVRTN